MFAWLALGLSALMLGSALLGRDGLLAVIVNARRLDGLRGEITTLEAENRRLRNEIRSLRGDLRAIERIAREDLGLVKPGETVYEFLPLEREQGEGSAGAPEAGEDGRARLP